MNLIVVTIRDSDDWNTHLDLYKYAKENYNSYKILNKNKFILPGESFYINDTLYIKNDVYIPLNKKETKSLTSHIILNKEKNINNKDKVGVIDIYLDNNKIYEEDIFILKKKNGKKKNILSKWFND